MLAIAGDSRPSMLIEYVARAISYFAGALPLASANKGKNSEDTSSEEQFLMDPQTYRSLAFFFAYSSSVWLTTASFIRRQTKSSYRPRNSQVTHGNGEVDATFESSLLDPPRDGRQVRSLVHFTLSRHCF